jgi:Tol biopolymer transport system component
VVVGLRRILNGLVILAIAWYVVYVYAERLFAYTGKITQSPKGTIRISIHSTGAQGNDQSRYPSLSADGRHVAFASDANNLVDDDTNGQPDIFVHDVQTSQTIRVSLASDGTEADRWCDEAAISGDGRYVAFASYATNLVPGDTNNCADIFIHDMQTGQLIRVSVASDGMQGDDGSHSPFISVDGRYVTFTSRSFRLIDDDTNGKSDIFVRDRDVDQDGILDEPGQVSTVRVSVASDGSEGNGSATAPSASDSGRYVTFLSSSDNLVEGDTNGWRDVFVHDMQTGQTTRVSVATNGTEANWESGAPFISANGRYVSFTSYASNLVNGDTNGANDVFVHDRQTGQTINVSSHSSHVPGNRSSYTSSISGDGRYVAFSSYASNLVEGDTNDQSDIFVRDLQTGWIIRILAAFDDGQGNGLSQYPFISADGRYVTFESSASNLVEGDANDVSDIFVRGRLFCHFYLPLILYNH